MAAMDQDWEGISYASEELRMDREVSFRAVGLSCMAFQYVPEDLRLDAEFKEIFRAGVKKDSRPIGHLPEKVRSDPEIMLLAMESDYQLIKKCTPELLADRSFILAAVKQDWKCMEFVPKEFYEDREIMMVA